MGLKQSIKAAPGVPMSVHAKKKGVSETTIRRAVKSLSMKSYALRKKHLITPEQRQQRLLKSKRILSSLKKGAKQLHFFSDEKIFTVDRARNSHNDQWICVDPEDVPAVMMSKNPASVMLLGVVSSEGHVMPPHFFQPKQRVNQEVYLETMEKIVKPWMDSVAGGREYTFQ